MFVEVQELGPTPPDQGGTIIWYEIFFRYTRSVAVLDMGEIASSPGVLFFMGKGILIS